MPEPKGNPSGSRHELDTFPVEMVGASHSRLFFGTRHLPFVAAAETAENHRVDIITHRMHAGVAIGDIEHGGVGAAEGLPLIVEPAAILHRRNVHDCEPRRVVVPSDRDRFVVAQVVARFVAVWIQVLFAEHQCMGTRRR